MYPRRWITSQHWTEDCSSEDGIQEVTVSSSDLPLGAYTFQTSWTGPLVI